MSIDISASTLIINPCRLCCLAGVQQVSNMHHCFLSQCFATDMFTYLLGRRHKSGRWDYHTKDLTAISTALGRSQGCSGSKKLSMMRTDQNEDAIGLAKRTTFPSLHHVIYYTSSQWRSKSSKNSAVRSLLSSKRS